MRYSESSLFSILFCGGGVPMITRTGEQKNLTLLAQCDFQEYHLLHSLIFIDREAREIMHLVASVYRSVRLSVHLFVCL